MADEQVAASGSAAGASPTDGTLETTRLETFADGVLAIAITLLILEVDVPDAEVGSSLGGALIRQWPSYAAYAVSFLTIGIIWVNHHHLFSVVARTDNTFLILNVIFLMTIAALPWPTALVAEYIRDDAGRTVATAVYGGTMVAISIMFNVVWRYAAHGFRLLREDIDRDALARVSRSYLLGPVVYTVATAVALLEPWWSLGMFALIALYWILPRSGPSLITLGRG